MYVSIYVQLFGRGSLNFLAISECSISQAVRFEDVRAGLPLRSSFREFDSAILAPLPSGSCAQRNSYSVSSTESSYKRLHDKEIEGLDFLVMYWVESLPGDVASTQGSYKPLRAQFNTSLRNQPLNFLTILNFLTMHPVATRQHRQGKASQGNTSQAHSWPTVSLAGVWPKLLPADLVTV